MIAECLVETAIGEVRFGSRLILIVESLQRFYFYYDEDLKVEFSYRKRKFPNLSESFWVKGVQYFLARQRQIVLLMEAIDKLNHDEHFKVRDVLRIFSWNGHWSEATKLAGLLSLWINTPRLKKLDFWFIVCVLCVCVIPELKVKVSFKFFEANITIPKQFCMNINVYDDTKNSGVS